MVCVYLGLEGKCSPSDHSGEIPFCYQGSHGHEKSLNCRKVLEKFLNSFASHCKSLQVRKCSSTLNVVSSKVFLALFDCPRQNINHSSEKLTVVYIKRFFMQ